MRLIFAAAFFCMLCGCAKAKRSVSDLAESDEQEGRRVLELEGFIVGGSGGSNQADANESFNTACSSFFNQLYRALDGYRLVDDSSYEHCKDRVDESPLRELRLYVGRPKIKLLLDPEDKVVVRDGEEISGAEARSYQYYFAYSSFLSDCFTKIAAAKAKLGAAMIAGTCGDAQTTVRSEYSADHRRELPVIKVSSRLRLYMRDGVEADEPQAISLERKPSSALVDMARAIASSGSTQNEVLISTFAGSLTKINLETGLKVWEKNLANPEVNSVRQTTSLEAIAVSSDYKRVAVGGNYGYLAIVDGATGHKIRMISCTPNMFAPKHYQALAFTQDQRTLLSVAARQEFPVFGRSYNSMRFSRAGDRGTQINNLLESWDPETGALRWGQEFKSGVILEVGLSADESTVFVVASDRVLLYAAVDGHLMQNFALSHFEAPFGGSFISGASFSPDLRLLALSGFSGVMLIDTQSHKLVRRLRAPLENELGKPEVSAERQLVRAFDAYGRIYEWDLRSGRLIGQGRANYALNANGPAQMPILSQSGGRFLLQTQSDFSSGSSVSLERLQPAIGVEKLCLAGEGNDLPDLTIRRSAKLMVWTRTP